MATGFFAVLDDIAILADDVSIATKIATQKTVGILGDDLAVNAEKATGFEQKRELQVIWAITKGSLLNKTIILPLAFLLSAFASWVIPYVLIFGGLYLLYEGAEKIIEYLMKHKSEDEETKQELLNSTNENILDIEKKKIKSAIVTDFILSIEIVIIALGAVINEPFLTQVISTTFVAILATLGVYGIVAIIVRMDNVGLFLIDKNYPKSGNFLIQAMPKVINILSVVGTIAMILVGGSILAHNIHPIHNLFIHSLPDILNELIVGTIGGIVVFAIMSVVHKFMPHKETA
jgi:predicted DNA repair protein MutK